MDKLVALNTLKEVVDAGGFTKAAQRLGVAASSVTRVIGALEASLGQPLVTRTTRSVTLTEVGEAYVEQVTRILGDLAQADESILDSGAMPAGTLRISVPATYSRIRLGTVFVAFLREYPNITLDIDDSDRYLDLASERIDLAIRIGTLDRDRGLVVKKLADSPRFVVASSAYIAQHGNPLSPQSIADHNCLRFAYGSGSRLARQRWTFKMKGVEEYVGVGGAMIANDLDLLFEAARAGRGIALLPQWLVHTDVHTGDLVRLFSSYQVYPPVGSAMIYAAYLPNRRYSSKVRAFLRFIEAHVQGDYGRCTLAEQPILSDEFGEARTCQVTGHKEK
jgi:DNA-binding transcriptional LysR family regulator